MQNEATQPDPFHSLAVRFRAGDPQAYQDLHDKLAKGLLLFLASRCRPGVNAEDLSQDVWLHVWKKRETFQDKHFKGWLYTIARRRLIDIHRKHSTVPLPEDFDPAASIVHSNSDAIDTMQDCLKQMDGAFVAVIKAHLSGMTTEDIASQHDIKSGTVYTRIDRGKKQLRECVEKKLQ